MNSEMFRMRYIYVSSLVEEAVKKALADKCIDIAWCVSSIWLVQVGENKIDIRLNNGRDETIASIEGRLSFVPGISLQASVFAPGSSYSNLP